MEQVVLEANRRDAGGKGAARQQRRDGMIPGVVYGMGKPAITLSVQRDSVESALKHQRGGNVLFAIRLEGHDVDPDVAALLKEIQRHPVTQLPESIDFQWVSLTETVIVMVPILLEGTSPAAEEGAVIEQIMYQAEVSCLPLEIPEQLVISIEGMELHDTRTAQEIVLPEGIELLSQLDDPVVSCAPPAKIEEEPREGEELEGELDELAEGEEPPEEGAEGEEAADADEAEADEGR